MVRFSAKLCSKRGETLVETLVSVLIVGLACLAFASMTVAASTINRSAKTADLAFYNELSAAEARSGTTDITVTMSWNWAATIQSQEYTVKCTGAAGELMSYSVSGGGGG